MQVVDSFQHTPLTQERSIRLLSLIRDSPTSISFTLDAFELDQLPEYEALSYTWGKATLEDDEFESDDPGIHQTILINSVSFTINENLYDGLCELRDELHEYLWVDALCIDQTNEQERASQITLMGEIYSSAKGVIIWLGKETPEVEAVLWLSYHYWDAFAAKVPPSMMASHLGLSTTQWAQLWRDHSAFYRRYRWFRRAWVVQEYVLARAINIRCGNKSLNPSTLTSLIHDINQKDLPYGIEVRHFYQINLCRLIIPNGFPDEGLIRSMSYIDLSRTPKQLWFSTLKHLAGMLRSQQVSCLHDKIYASFGIAKISLPPSFPNPDVFRVDYQQTVNDLFISFTSEIFRNLPTLSTLSSSEGLGLGERKRKGLPSWCPDYGRGTLATLVQRREQMQYGIPGFAASFPLTDVSIPCQVDGTILRVTGKKIDGIAEISQRMTHMFSIHRMRTNSTGITKLLDACLKMDPIHSITGQDRLEVLWRTLIQNIDFAYEGKCEYPADNTKFSQLFGAYITLYTSAVLKELEGKERDEYVKLLKFWEESFRSSAGFPLVSTIVGFATSTSVADGWVSHPLFDKCNTFCIRASPCANGRRLFITSQKWLGLGPEFLEPNDELWLLKHAAVPFILRPYGESQYQLVGEAYVHGIMHGELVAAPGGREGFGEIEIV
ncbi:HET-domain-containing protein [Stipitochalara longipes BDJ]|nr:HET-domain-containing protein [Stipitochalara longipes BDJ]